MGGAADGVGYATAVSSPTYRRYLPKAALDTPAVRAAANFVLALDEGKTPDAATMRTLRDAFLEIFGGVRPQSLFGAPLGLVRPPGRPLDHGFTTANIVSAHVELRRRVLVATLGDDKALAAARTEAVRAFWGNPDNAGEDNADSAERVVRRYWANKEGWVQQLTDDELEAIIAPYKIPGQ